MALSFGDLTGGSGYSFGTPVSAADTQTAYGLSLGTPVINSVYDDAVMRAARRQASEAQPLTFGDVLASENLDMSQRLSFGGMLSGAADFVFGSPSRSGETIYDDAVMRAARNGVPNATDYTTGVDGGARNLSGIRDLANSITAGMGSTGDGEIMPAAYLTNEQGGFNPLVIAGIALAAGAIYYAVSK